MEAPEVLVLMVRVRVLAPQRMALSTCLLPALRAGPFGA